MKHSAREACKRAAAAALFLFCALAHGESRYLVVAANPLAADAGASVLRQGGTAADAAVAVQAMLGLVEPQSSGVGGGAFLLYWSAKDRSLHAYDGRETAPASARRERFLDAQGKPLPIFEAIAGGRSVGVPGAIRMLELAHSRHGRLGWEELFAPAIFSAEEGFAVSPRLHALLSSDRFAPRSATLFYERDGRPKPVGAKLVNRDYGATLRAIAQKGADALYKGRIAEDIVRAVASGAAPGGMTAVDLAAYRAVERSPVCGPYREWRVCSMPPPSSGGIAVLQILALLERTPFPQAAPDSADAAHYFAEAGRLAFRDRARFVGDPDFTTVPTAKLLSPAYLDDWAKGIGARGRRAAPAAQGEVPGTSHFVIVDGEGNVASMTTSIEAPFGSRVFVDGFLLNNELTDFDFAPGGPNEVGPGKRPRSSMAPTIVFDREGNVRLAIGSAGGSFIINYVAKTLVAVLDWRRDLASAIAMPNFGSRGGPVEIELGTRYEPLAAILAERGHEVAIREMESGLHGLERVQAGPAAFWRGGVDPRREGAARGD
ncbi:MAG: gamma-glutamyltransferase [Betaproteobacteria bacterium]|nr:gamma-glutamyltransferase [Betaproteobacteria bacterium]